MQPCTIEIRPLTDNGGQPLTFRPPGLVRRCVTEEVFNHPAVQRYIQRRMLIECDASSVVKKSAIKAAPAPAPEPVKTPKSIAPAPAPAVETPPAPVAVLADEPVAPAPEPSEVLVQAPEPVEEIGTFSDDGLDGEKTEEDSASTPEPNEDGTSAVTLRRRRRR